MKKKQAPPIFTRIVVLLLTLLVSPHSLELATPGHRLTLNKQNLRTSSYQSTQPTKAQQSYTKAAFAIFAPRDAENMPSCSNEHIDQLNAVETKRAENLPAPRSNTGSSDSWDTPLTLVACLVKDHVPEFAFVHQLPAL